ncbi:MAG: cell division protein FtsZ [Bacteroidaceae bacterium]|nr:cell division protein FtsZ [Bacteroidaceae bacterium]
MNEYTTFGLPEDLPSTPTPSGANSASIIKVIGVGGGGGNAVANMYREQIQGVRFLVANTDAKALEDSPVPEKLQIGPGLGAGGRPEMGQALAEQHLQDIKDGLGDETKMVFVTAGMGGGTGTGAGPIIAREAMEKGILTIGIVTIPFAFEMKRQIDKALDGVERMAEHVDALLVVNNERLRQVHSDLSVLNAFRKADETLTKAVRSIVEIINMRGTMNLDFNDVDTCLRGGGVAVMSTGYGDGNNRVEKAINDALNSPLLNDKEVQHSRKLCIAFFFPPDSSPHTLKIEEMNQIEEFMKGFNVNVETKWGYAEDEALTDEVKVTILASGFKLDSHENELKAELPLTPEQLERERQRDERRDKAYGNTQKRVRYNRIYIFEPEDLDNDELIANVDAIPVYKRTDNDLRNLRNISSQATPLEVIL